MVGGDADESLKPVAPVELDGGLDRVQGFGKGQAARPIDELAAHADVDVELAGAALVGVQRAPEVELVPVARQRRLDPPVAAAVERVARGVVVIVELGQGEEAVHAVEVQAGVNVGLRLHQARRVTPRLVEVQIVEVERAAVVELGALPERQAGVDLRGEGAAPLHRAEHALDLTLILCRGGEGKAHHRKGERNAGAGVDGRAARRAGVNG